MASKDEALQRIFDLMVGEMEKILSEGKTVVDKETGEAVKVSPDASTLNVIRQLLKDNNIGASEGPNGALNNIAQKVPFPAHTDPKKGFN